MSTYGEGLISNILTKITASRKDYYFVHEPTINIKGRMHTNPDFVIVSAKTGVIVLEVKDWVTILSATKSEITIQRRNGEIVTERNPVETARQYALNLSDSFKRNQQLTRSGNKNQLIFPWIHAAAFPNIDNAIIEELDEKGIWGNGVAFGKQHLTETRFIHCLDGIPFPFPLKQPLDNATLDIIRGILDPRVVLEGGAGVETVRQTMLIREPIKYTAANTKPEQGKLLLDDDMLTEETAQIAGNSAVRLVRGVAGSGKSLVLARRAQFLAEQHPDKRMLIMAFNKDLIKDLNSRISGAPNLEIKTFHAVCHDIIKHTVPFKKAYVSIEKWLEDNLSQLINLYGFTTEFAAQEIEWRRELEIYDMENYLTVEREGRGKALSRDKRIKMNQIFDTYMTAHHEHKLIDWFDVPKLALSELKRGHPMRANYDVILIDEAQDFAPSWIDVVKRLNKPDGALFLCDDPTQSLFRSFSWRQKGVEVVGKTRILRVPFRCTREITLAAHSLIHNNKGKNTDEILEPDLSSYELATGEKPSLGRLPDLNQEIDYIEKTAYAIADQGIPPKKIAILCLNKRMVKHWKHLQKDGFYVESFKKMKGLEFHAVLLPNLNTLFNDENDAQNDETSSAEVRQLFTAMTRARETLILSYHAELPKQLKVLEPFVNHENKGVYGRLR